MPIPHVNAYLNPACPQYDRIRYEKTSDLFDGPRLQVELEGVEPNAPNMLLSSR